MQEDYLLAVYAVRLIFWDWVFSVFIFNKLLSYSPAVGSRSHFWQYGLTNMDPAGEEFVRSAIAHQGALLGHQASQLSSTAQEVETLTAQVAELSGRFRELQQNVLLSSASAAPLPLSHREPEPHANNPPLYDGDPNSCRAFLSQCSLVFVLQTRRYATERLKIAYVITRFSSNLPSITHPALCHHHLSRLRLLLQGSYWFGRWSQLSGL